MALKWDFVIWLGCANHLATMILAGDNTLNERLRMICHEPLRGRIRYRYQLKPLDLTETKDYVNLKSGSKPSNQIVD